MNMLRRFGQWAGSATAFVLVFVAYGAASSAAPSLKQVVDADRALPTFKAPGPPVNVPSLRGKSIFVIPQAANPFNQGIVDTMKQVADSVGVRMTIYNNQSQTSQWIQGMDTAIAEKADLIVLSAAPDPRVLQPQLQKAKAAGIPVLVTHFYDESSPPPPACMACAAGVTSIVTAPFNRAGRDEADWIIDDSGGKADVLIVGATEDIVSDGIVATMKAEYQHWCATTCAVRLIQIPVPEWNTKTQSEIAAQLTAHPSIRYVNPLFDAMVQGAVQAVNTVGKSTSVKVVSFNGSTFALKFIEQHNVAAMDVGESVQWIGYADMDQAFRLLSKLPSVDEHTPIRVFDATNVDETGTPPSLLMGYGDSFVAGYRTLWGLGVK